MQQPAINPNWTIKIYDNYHYLDAMFKYLTDGNP